MASVLINGVSGFFWQAKAVSFPARIMRFTLASLRSAAGGLIGSISSLLPQYSRLLAPTPRGEKPIRSYCSVIFFRLAPPVVLVSPLAQK